MQIEQHRLFFTFSDTPLNLQPIALGSLAFFLSCSLFILVFIFLFFLCVCVFHVSVLFS